MAKQKFQGGIKTLSEKAKSRIPRVAEDVYKLNISDAEEEAPEGKVINDIEITGFATITEITVESVAMVNNGEAVRVNGELEISLVDDDENVVDKVFPSKDEAVEAWQNFMEAKAKVAEAKLNAYTNLVSFLRSQINQGNY